MYISLQCSLLCICIQDVGQVLVGSDGAAKGVVLKDGTEIHSKVVLSNATPYVTFKKLTPQVIKRSKAPHVNTEYQNKICSLTSYFFHCRAP